MTEKRRGDKQVTLSRTTVIGYGAASGPFEMLRAPALAILPALYSAEYGLALTTISFALLLLRLSDSATDLIVGTLSDRTRSRWGPRKPWLLASIFIALPAAYGLYAPGENVSIWTFSICYFFFYLAWTMFEIPYTAWSTELARGYEDRSRLALSRGVFGSVALVLLSLVPLLPFLPNTEMTFHTTEVIFWIIAIAYPLGVLFAFFFVPKGELLASQSQVRLRESFRAIRDNRPMLLFLCIAFCADLAMGISGAMFFLLFDSYLGLGASFSLIFLTAIAVSTVSLKLWEVVVKRTSKTRLLTVCLAGGVIWGLSVSLLRPGPYTLPMFMVFLSAYYVFSAGRDVALYATIGDVVDYDSLKTGSDRAGLFSSGWMVLRKLAYAVGPAVGFFVAGVVGYDPSAEQNDTLGIFGLKASNGYLPALLLAIALLLALRFPITPEKHRTIRRRLEQRHARVTGV